MSKKKDQLEQIVRELRTQKEVENYLRVQLQGKEKIEYFYQYLNAYVSRKNMPIHQVISASRINKNYVYNITNGSKKRPGREKIVALCLGAEMNYDELNQGLETGGYRRLDPEDERDVWIAVFVNQKRYDVLQLNIVLADHGLKLLDI